jgi:hypothetical protein
MVASLQKQTDSMDVRAIEITIKTGDTVVDVNGAAATIGEAAVIFNAVDIPAGAIVLSAAMVGIAGATAIGVGITTSGVDLLAVTAVDAAVAPVAVPLLIGNYSASTPVYLKADDFSTAQEAAVVITYILRGSSEYNI